MQPTNYTVNDLPELPLEALSLGGELRPAETEPVLTILPKDSIQPDRPSNPSGPGVAHECKASSYYARRHFTQVTYPRVICYPNTPPSGDVMMRVFKELEVAGAKGSPASRGDLPQTRYYKLSSYRDSKLEHPMFCTVHGGPWAATVIETQSCDCDADSTKWEIFIHGLPQLYMLWFGRWEDIPSDTHPNLGVFLNDLYQVEEAFFCCPGYNWCETTHSCIPQTVNCRSPEHV